MESRIPARLSAAEGRRFGLTVGAAFAALGALLYWRGFPRGSAIAGGIGALLILSGLMAPVQLSPVHWAWMRLALAMSKVTTPIFMAVVFYLVLTPTGLLMRLFGHRPLAPAREGTHWVTRPEADRRSSLERQF